MEVKPQFKDGVVYSVNEYYPKRLSVDKVLVTTRHGGWIVLENDEYGLLFDNKVIESMALFRKLESTGIILTEKSVKDVISSFSRMYGYIIPKSVLCIINATNKCSLNCSYCFVSSKCIDSDSGEDLDTDIATEILNFIKNMPPEVIGIEFQGGEPLLCFDMIKKFHEAAKDIITRNGKILDSFVIVSNLTLMNEEIADFILRNNIGLCSSLDGPKSLHDKQRTYFDGRGSYDDVVKWHDYFRSKGKIINMLPTITGISLKYGARSIIDEYLKHGCNTINFRPIYMGTKAKDNAGLWLEPKKYAAFWIEGIEYMAKLTREGKVVYDEFSRGLIRNMLNSTRTYMCARRPCGAGISQLSFGMDGSIYACDLAKNVSDFRVGDVEKSTYHDVYMNSISFISNTPEFQPLCDTCAYSAFCPSCASRVFSRRRSLCAFTPKDFDCKVYKKVLEYLFRKSLDLGYRDVFKKWAMAK